MSTPSSSENASSTTPPHKEAHRNTCPALYSLEKLSECPHKRHEAGRDLLIEWPDGNASKSIVPSECVVWTKGSALALESDPNSPDDPASNKPQSPSRACAHFSYEKVCLRGVRCYFIHVVCVNPPPRLIELVTVQASKKGKKPAPSSEKTNPDKDSSEKLANTVSEKMSTQKSSAPSRSFKPRNVSGLRPQHQLQTPNPFSWLVQPQIVMLPNPQQNSFSAPFFFTPMVTMQNSSTPMGVLLQHSPST